MMSRIMFLFELLQYSGNFNTEWILPEDSSLFLRFDSVIIDYDTESNALGASRRNVFFSLEESESGE